MALREGCDVVGYGALCLVLGGEIVCVTTVKVHMVGCGVRCGGECCLGLEIEWMDILDRTLSARKLRQDVFICVLCVNALAHMR